MLPLKENDLNSPDDWHKLKDILVVANLCDSKSAKQKYSTLPEHLKNHPIGKAVKRFLTTRNKMILNKAAKQLTQREIRDAWLVLERL
jgi:hypothetical protein